MHHTEIETLAEFDAHLAEGRDLRNCVFQGLDLSERTAQLLEGECENSLFLGCVLAEPALEKVGEGGALVFPKLPRTPFRSYRGELYSPEELLGDYRIGEPDSYEETLDKRVYDHFVAHGRDESASIVETLARRLHDHAITDALQDFIRGRKIVAIMGGHAMRRETGDYREVVLLGKELAECDFLVATGGGPGAMEAAHLGASFAGRDESEVDAAISILAEAPTYRDEMWLDAAFRVRRDFLLSAGETSGRASLGIPTWLYGHEPPTVFASHIAKYFANSVREEGLLAIAKNGVVFSPGSAGTIQEIFQDATQNHYVSFGVVSPMVLFGSDYWQRRKPVFPLLSQLAAGRDYARHLHLCDARQEIVEILREFAETGS